MTATHKVADDLEAHHKTDADMGWYVAGDNNGWSEVLAMPRFDL